LALLRNNPRSRCGNTGRLRSGAAASEHLIQFVPKDADGVELVDGTGPEKANATLLLRLILAFPGLPQSRALSTDCGYGQVCLSIRIVSATQVGKSGGEHCVLRIGG
jgi:hypothetical protein